MSSRRLLSLSRRRGPGRTAAIALAAAAAVAAATGCTQLAQLQPVAGNDITAVTIATSDVLLDQKVDVLVFPVCKFGDGTYTCTGKTKDGKPIVSTAPSNDAPTLKVSVDGKEIFNGTVDDVLTTEGRKP